MSEFLLKPSWIPNDGYPDALHLMYSPNANPCCSECSCESPCPYDQKPSVCCPECDESCKEKFTLPKYPYGLEDTNGGIIDQDKEGEIVEPPKPPAPKSKKKLPWIFIFMFILIFMGFLVVFVVSNWRGESEEERNESYGPSSRSMYSRGCGMR
jgi:hypothetical protein